MDGRKSDLQNPSKSTKNIVKDKVREVTKIISRSFQLERSRSWPLLLSGINLAQTNIAVQMTHSDQTAEPSWRWCPMPLAARPCYYNIIACMQGLVKHNQKDNYRKILQLIEGERKGERILKSLNLLSHNLIQQKNRHSARFPLRPNMHLKGYMNILKTSNDLLIDQVWSIYCLRFHVSCHQPEIHKHSHPFR